MDHTAHSTIKFTSQYQQSNLHNIHKTQDRFDEGHDSYGIPGSFCDVEYLDNTQYFDEVDIPSIIPLCACENSSVDEVNDSVLAVDYKSNNDSSSPVQVDIP